VNKLQIEIGAGSRKPASVYTAKGRLVYFLEVRFFSLTSLARLRSKTRRGTIATEFARNMTRRWHIKDILVGILAMLMSVIALAIVLVAVLFIYKREIAIGPVYFLIPVLAFAAGFYWSLRRSSRPKAPPKPPSNVAIIVKSSLVGVTAMIISAIAYFVWIWIRIPRQPHSFVAIDAHLLFYWPILLGGFLAGFILEYRRVSGRHSAMTGRTAQ
jgi:hypothetical protein